jgi:cytochrome c oxidase subunit III
VQRSFPVPRRANTIGMYLFLASLAMLFFASMLGYVLIRVMNSEVAFGSVQLPNTLLLSTLFMLAGSFTMHRALVKIRQEKQPAFRLYLTMTILFAVLFVFIQTPAMLGLWEQHSTLMNQWTQDRLLNPVTPPPHTPGLGDERIPGQRSVPFYGLVMVLILIHAMHVIGGMVALGVVAYNGYRNQYDHEAHAGVRNCVLYWHFLDAVWIMMYAIVWAFG